MLIRFLAAPEDARGDLYRALRADVDFPFVEIASGATYEVVHEDGDPDGDGGALLIELFEVTPDRDEEFRAAWNTTRQALAAAQGYLGSRLYRGEADFRYVGIVRWSSPLMFARVEKPAMPFASHPALYQAVRD